MSDEESIVLEAKIGKDRDLSLDTDIRRCIILCLHTLNLNINEELVDADLRHFWLGVLASEVFREQFAEWLGRGGIASTKSQTIELSWDSDILCHPLTAAVNKLLQTFH